MDKLTVIMEGYLETIYALCQNGGGARLTDIAARLSVSKATANRAAAVLTERGLVTGAKYRELTLTAKGQALARRMIGRHAAIERLLIEVLRVSPGTAQRDACAVEHILSDEAVEAIQRYLEKLSI